MMIKFFAQKTTKYFLTQIPIIRSLYLCKHKSEQANWKRSLKHIKNDSISAQNFAKAWHNRFSQIVLIDLRKTYFSLRTDRLCHVSKLLPEKIHLNYCSPFDNLNESKHYRNLQKCISKSCFLRLKQLVEDLQKTSFTSQAINANNLSEVYQNIILPTSLQALDNEFKVNSHESFYLINDCSKPFEEN